jgi:hypothetical protein
MNINGAIYVPCCLRHRLRRTAFLRACTRTIWQFGWYPVDRPRTSRCDDTIVHRCPAVIGIPEVIPATYTGDPVTVGAAIVFARYRGVDG